MANWDTIVDPAAFLAAALLLHACATSGRTRALPRRGIPTPVVPARALARLYRRAWKLAWAHLRAPELGSGFVSDYIDPGFNGDLFQWDLCFIAQYAKYGHRVFPTPVMLSNLYAKQQPDGFIPRQIATTGDPVKFGDALNPPLYSWAEWDSYRIRGDRTRLAQVLPVLARFHRWIVNNRRNADGLYRFEDPLGSGMDDQPRRGSGWIDLSSQMALDARCLALIAGELSQNETASAYAAEHAQLADSINRVLWNEDRRWYEDAGGADFKSVAGFWPLLAGVAPEDRAAAVIGRLTDPHEFWRPTPVPSVSADSAIYNAPDGDYWRGAVWPPTNYMIVRGLLEVGRPGLAKTIALEYLRSMVTQLEAQGTLFEHCSPERDCGGGVKDMVGWAGVGPIALLIEAVLGLRADAPTNTLSWTPLLRARHGIEDLTFGACTASIVCAARSPDRDYVIRVETDRPFTLRVATDFAEGTTRLGERSLGPLDDGVACVEVPSGSTEYRIRGEPRLNGTPPAQPRDLVATRSEKGTVLRWRACADEDLAGYDVYRTEDHGWRKINSSLCVWSTCTDDHPPDSRCSYAVAAVDTADNISPMSEPAELA